MSGEERPSKKKSTEYDIKAPKFSSAASGEQAGRYEKTMKAVAEYVAIEYGYEMKVLVMHGKETVFEPPQERKMLPEPKSWRGARSMISILRMKKDTRMRRQKCLP